MSVMEELLQRLNLKYEDLSEEEQKTLTSWMEDLNKNQMTVEKIKGYISSMRETVELELTKVENGSKQDILLKARLRNYMLFDAFLTSPEKAKAAIERSLAGIKGKKA